ncbi:unnamed protein product [Ilex paraguariensis]|uniref:Transcription factor DYSFUNCTIONAL TAPETUM 1 n=1 Tax=Ilex paraguariensis TaxID=185542 RepID=A0ABC8S8C2_9AQUA
MEVAMVGSWLEKMKGRRENVYAIAGGYRRQTKKGTVEEGWMNKATIITDAVDYIKGLQKSVVDLEDQLLQMESTFEEEAKIQNGEIVAAEEMKKWGIKPEVQVTAIDGNKLWIKMVYEKKRGGFTRLMESLSVLGFDLNNTSVTTSRGTILVTSCLEEIHGGIPEADRIGETLLDLIRGT